MNVNKNNYDFKKIKEASNLSISNCFDSSFIKHDKLIYSLNGSSEFLKNENGPDKPYQNKSKYIQLVSQNFSKFIPIPNFNAIKFFDTSMGNFFYIKNINLMFLLKIYFNL